MTTTVHERQQPDSARYPAQADFGGHGNVTSESGSWRAVEDRAPASRTGIWVGLAAITMTFAAFTSAMVVRQGSSTDWRHFALPSVLYLNTAILLTSSVTLELARQRVGSRIAAALRDSVALAVCDSGTRLVVRRRPICGLAQAEVGGAIPGDQPQ